MMYWLITILGCIISVTNVTWYFLYTEKKRELKRVAKSALDLADTAQETIQQSNTTLQEVSDLKDNIVAEINIEVKLAQLLYQLEEQKRAGKVRLN